MPAPHDNGSDLRATCLLLTNTFGEPETTVLGCGCAVNESPCLTTACPFANTFGEAEAEGAGGNPHPPSHISEDSRAISGIATRLSF
jgi:hypothetical protein